jgi:hypothetical protein
MKKKDFDERMKALKEEIDICEDPARLAKLCKYSLNLAQEAFEMNGEQLLAKAVYDFADWQTTSYKWEDETRAEIGRRLWSEVSSRVDSAIQVRPENPCSNA